jgi:dihydroflavonol-4-reductase
MNKVLVTGASSFLGYHVAKRLNEQGIRPRVLDLPGASRDPLSRLDVEQAGGHLEDARAVADACAGVDTVLHLAFKVSLAGGQEAIDEMRKINVVGTQRLLDAAAAAGASRAVVVGSALGVGVNRRPEPLDENASWPDHSFDVPYAINRREAEQEALGRAGPGFAVVVVCPAFTLGPDDPVGAPANKLIGTLIRKKLWFTLPVGFGVLDVRDFADGVLRAAERGKAGQRYLISGHNVTTNQLLAEAAAVAGVRAPRFEPPMLLVRILAGALGLFGKLTGKPGFDTSILQIVRRYAWYDTTRARTELGWEPRPLKQTLEDTIRSLRDPSMDGLGEQPPRNRS